VGGTETKIRLQTEVIVLNKGGTECEIKKKGIIFITRVDDATNQGLKQRI